MVNKDTKMECGESRDRLRPVKVCGIKVSTSLDTRVSRINISSVVLATYFQIVILSFILMFKESKIKN